MNYEERLCRTCIYGDKTEYDKPCIIYSDNCQLYKEKKHRINEELIEGLKLLAHTMKRDGDPYYQRIAEDAIKALEQEPTDAVSRSELQKTIDSLPVFNFVHNGHEEADDYYNCESVDMVIRNLPPVTPQQRVGRWIQTKDDCDGVNFYDFSFECSKCGKEQSFKSNYCPNCGAYMRESEDKE